MFFNFILAYDYVTNTFVSVNTLQSLRLGTDKLKSNNNYTKNYFDENNNFHIFVKTLIMKTIFLILLLSFSIGLSAQKTGYIFYQNVDSVNKSKEEFKNLGLKMEFAPIKIDLRYFPKIQNVIFDYKVFFQTWYRQVNDVIFLDDESFSRLSKKEMIVQDIIYQQEKNTDYKWDGKKYFETPHVFSKIYFTAMVIEYSDKFILNIKIAEKLKN